MDLREKIQKPIAVRFLRCNKNGAAIVNNNENTMTKQWGGNARTVTKPQWHSDNLGHMRCTKRNPRGGEKQPGNNVETSRNKGAGNRQLADRC
jgi:hypothetical protein